MIDSSYDLVELSAAALIIIKWCYFSLNLYSLNLSNPRLYYWKIKN